MDQVNRTLYIPLYGKAYVSRRGLFLQDTMAQTIWQTAGFDLKGKAKSKWLAYNMGMRAAVFDSWVREMTRRNPGAVVLHLGCGLDSRYCRVRPAGGSWYDMDFPEVIAERRRYFREEGDYHMCDGDLREKRWLEAIPRADTAIVVMEGVSMYLKLPELGTLLENLTAHFGKVFLLMDVYTRFAAKATKYKNPINTVGVTQVYGMDRPEEAVAGSGISFRRELELTPEELIRQLPRAEQGFFRAVFAGKMAKKIYRLYEYTSE